MGEQLTDGHAASCVLAIVRNVVREVSLQLNFSLVNKLQNKQSRELLCHRTDLEFRVHIIRDIPVAARKSESPLVNDASTAGDQNRSVELTSCSMRLHDLIYSSCQPELGGCAEQSTGRNIMIRAGKTLMNAVRRFVPFLPENKMAGLLFCFVKTNAPFFS